MASAQQISEWLATGKPQIACDIRAVAAPESAGPHDAVFATSPGALADALASKAGLILVAEKLETGALADVRLLAVPDARLAFAVLGAALQPACTPMRHPSAVIDDAAQLHVSVRVGAGAVIGAGVQIDEGSEVGTRAVLEPGVKLGQRVRVQAGAVLGSIGFGYARRPDGTYLLFPQQGTLVVENDVEIGANSTIDRGALGETRIGSGTKIDNLVHIGHNCRIGRNVVIAAQTGISGSSVVEDGAVLGGQVGIGEHALVGRGVILGGGAGVLSNKQLRGAGAVFWGRPAQPLKQYLRDLARLRRGGA